MRRLSIILSATAVAVVVMALAVMAGSSDIARANPDTVNAGYDLLETDGTGGVTLMDFSGTPIPADFFGPGSDPFTSSVNLEGVPLGSFGAYNGLGPTDTIVRRLQDAMPTFPDTIDIEIVALHLQSVAPITVTYNGGQNPETWDLDIEVPEGDQNQTLGSMTIDHEYPNGGTFSSTLPVDPIMTFVRVGDQFTLAGYLSNWTAVLLLQATGENWCHDANPLHNPPFQWVIEKSGLTTNFFPGINCEPVTTKDYFAMDATVAVHAVQPAEVPGPNYKCYDIFDSPPGVPPVILETQFGIEEVPVGPAAFLCPPAVIDGDVDLVTLQEDWPHLKCYDILGQDDPPHIVDLETQFGLEEDVAIGPAKLLCMPTVKTPQTPPGPPSGPLVSSPHYECFEIVDPPPGVPPVALETQFGLEPGVPVLTAEYLCAPALKNGEGDLSMPHLKCYDIFADEPEVGWEVLLETQFIGFEELVTVGQAQLLCVTVQKTVTSVGGIAAFPDVEEPVVGSAGSSDGSSFPYAALAGGLAALGLVAAGGVYARRRFSRS